MEGAWFRLVRVDAEEEGGDHRPSWVIDWREEEGDAEDEGRTPRGGEDPLGWADPLHFELEATLSVTRVGLERWLGGELFPPPPPPWPLGEP